MTKYHCIVKDNVIFLPKGVHLQDGTKVEVTVVSAAIGEHISQESLEAAEEAFEQGLLEKGLILEIKKPSIIEPEGDRRPIRVKGKPMSQMIVEDRR